MARLLLSPTARGRPNMAKRSVVRIDEDKCTGCGLCVPSCAEGALEIIDGKARLVKEIYCDGLGACLGECPEDAITVEERDAEAFDQEAVTEHLARQRVATAAAGGPPSACPGAMMRTLETVEPAEGSVATAECVAPRSHLGHWPVQIHLVPIQGEIWKDADVLICADCVPLAMPDFHERLLAGKTVAVGCPKLDDIDAHTDKLAGIFASNPIRSVTVAHMEVPCCTGIVVAVQRALEQAGRDDVEFRDVTVGINGAVLLET